MSDTKTTKAKVGAALYALSRIDHDGKVFEAGDALPDMPEHAAEALRTCGVISAVKPQEDAPTE